MNRASKSTLEYPIGFWSFAWRELHRLDTTAAVVGCSGTEEVMSRRSIKKSHLFEGVLLASM